MLYSHFEVEFSPRNQMPQIHKLADFNSANVLFQSVCAREDIQDAAIYVANEKQRFCFVTKEGWQRMIELKDRPGIVRAQ